MPEVCSHCLRAFTWAGKYKSNVQTLGFLKTSPLKRIAQLDFYPVCDIDIDELPSPFCNRSALLAPLLVVHLAIIFTFECLWNLSSPSLRTPHSVAVVPANRPLHKGIGIITAPEYEYQRNGQRFAQRYPPGCSALNPFTAVTSHLPLAVPVQSQVSCIALLLRISHFRFLQCTRETFLNTCAHESVGTQSVRYDILIRSKVSKSKGSYCFRLDDTNE